jgi:uncharacterized membrane protein (DUF4010 family)
VLGGLYSSTVTTVVLARRARDDAAMLRQAQTGIILATAVMYVRLLIIVVIFDRQLAWSLAPALLMLSLVGLVLAGLWYRVSAAPQEETPSNPLEISAAFIFAALFFVISLASAWVRSEFGERGLFVLAGVVGAADIDPFVLSIAAGGSAFVPVAGATAAMLIAASSNNLMKAAYAAGFSSLRTSAAPAVTLCFLALGGAAAAWWIGLKP